MKSCQVFFYKVTGLAAEDGADNSTFPDTIEAFNYRPIRHPHQHLTEAFFDSLNTERVHSLLEIDTHSALI